MLQVEIDLDRGDARQTVPDAAARQHAGVVGPDDLDVGAALVAPQAQKISRGSRIAVDVQTDEPEPSPPIQGPGGRQAGEGVVDPRLG